MVAIFTGSGAGLERGSGSVLGKAGLLGSSSLGRGGEQLFLNAATGNLVINREDEFLVGRGPDVAIARTYNSLADVGDDNNDNWRQSTDRRIFDFIGPLNAWGSSVKRASGDGSVVTYAWDGTAYVATDGAGAHDKLTYSGAWIWTDGDSQITESYHAYGSEWRIAYQTDTSGNSLSFTYAGSSLTRITSANGEYVDYTWSGSNITSIVTQAGGTLTRTRYTYDTSNRLSSVTVDLSPNDNSVADGNVYTTNYTYHGSTKLVASIGQTDGSQVAIAYDGSNRVSTVTQTVASGVTRVTSLSYGADYTNITDPAGQVTRLDFAPGNQATEIATWGTSNVTQEAATIDGGPATKFTVQSNGWAGAAQGVSVLAGDTVTFGLTVQGVGATSTYYLGLYGTDGSYWGADAHSSARIVSGPGQLVQAVGGFWALTGASASQGTRIEITRTYTQAQTAYAYLYPDHPNYQAGTAIIVADATLLKNSSAVTTSTMDLGNWWTGGVDRTAAGTIHGAAAYQLTVQSGSTWSAAYNGFSASRGDTFTYSLSLQAVGDATMQYLGLYGGTTLWGGNGTATARIVSGPGTITQSTGGLFLVSGLSTGQATRVEITRTYTQDESGGVYLYVDHAYGPRAGAALIAAGPHLARRITEPATAGQLLKITTPPPQSSSSAQVVQLAYNNKGDLISVIDALNQTATYTYDANGNVLTSTDRLGNVVTRTYGSKNELLTETRTGSDASGATNLHTTRHAYDSLNRRVYSVSAEGHVTRYWYHANGQQYWTNDFPDHVYDVSALTPSTALTASQLDSWCLTLSDTSSSQISYTTFDGRGNADATRGYNVPDGFAWLNAAQDYSYQNFVYDPAGRLLSRQRNGQSPETFVYDGLGRLIASTDLNGGTTSFYFNDAAQQTVVTLANGLVQTSTYNKAGELVSSTEAGDYVTSGTATYQYDRNGRLRVATDATGNNSYFLFDKVGRKVADVGADGSFVEYRYDANDRVIARTRYYSQLTSAQFAQVPNPEIDVDVPSIRPALTGAEEWAWTVYDSEGRPIEAIEGDGSVTAYQYDASGRLVRTTAYATKLSAGQLSAFKTAPPASPVLPGVHADDAVTRSFYDKDGRLIGSLDGEGFLSRTTYDKAGRKTVEEAFFTATSASLRASGTFAQLLASVGTHANDRRTRYVYDGQGQLRFAIDSLNQVTGYGYDAPTAGESHGLVRTTTLYAGTIGALSSYTYTAVKNAIAGAGLTSHSGNRISYNVYDEGGRLAYTIDALGGLIGHIYDSQGEVTRTIQYNTPIGTSVLPTKAAVDTWVATYGGSSANRVTRNYYTDRGELKFAIDAEGYVTQFDYDAEGRIISERRWDTAVSANDSWITNTVAVSVGGNYAQTSVAYDGMGRILWEYDALGTPTYYWYRGNGQLASKTVAYGTADEAVTAYYYDEAGMLVSQYDAWGTAEQTVTSYTYDAFGNVIQVSDWMSSTTRTYDQLGQLLTESRGGVTTSYEYNAFGEAVTTTVGDGATSSTSYTYYDQLGRAVVSRDAESYLTETSYTLFGEVASVTRRYNRTTDSPSTTVVPTAAAHAGDATTSFLYDKLGQVTRTTDAEGHYEEYWYNAAGNRTQVRNKLDGITHHGYTLRGQLSYDYVIADIHDATGAVTASAYYSNIYQYDARGNVAVHVEAYGLPERRNTWFTYDKANRLTRTERTVVSVLSQADHASTSAVAPVETFAYDKRGNVIETVDALGARTLSYYDDLDRKVAEIDALGTYTAFTYDGVGNLSSRRVHGTQIALPATAGGVPPAPPGGTNYRETTYTYDALNRLRTTSVANVRSGAWNGSVYATAIGTVTTSYDYDANGNVIKTTDANGGAVHGYYDKLGRKYGEIDQENYLTVWDLDAEGNAKSERRHAIRVVGAPPLYGLPAASTNADDRVTMFTYDRNGRRLTETREAVSAYYVNGSGGLNAASTSSTVSYLYNALGQMVYKTEAAGESTDYGYDVSGRLTSEIRVGYTDHNGAWVRPTVNHYYNAHGDLVRTRQAAYTGASGERITTYAYDAGGRMASVTDAAGATRDYYYDVAGNLLRESHSRLKSDGGTSLDGILTTRDLLGRATLRKSATWNGGWSGEAQTMAYNAYGELSHRGLNGLWQEQFHYDGLGRLAASNEGDGVWRFHVYDGAGNRTLTIESEGTSLSTYDREQVLAIATGSGSWSVGGAYVDGINATIGVFDKRGLATQTRQPERQLNASTRTAIVTSRAYNAFGEATSETDARGFSTDFFYNSMGRLTAKQRPLVNYTVESGAVYAARPEEYLYYDLSGRLIGARDANGYYTVRGLLAGSGFGGTEALVTAEFHSAGIARIYYDHFGDARILRNELGQDESRSYDGMGRLTQQVHRGSLLTDSYVYDLLGQRIQHWTNVSTFSDRENTDYDAQGRIVSQRAFGGDTTTTGYAWSSDLGTAGMATYGGWTETATHANGLTSIEQSDRFGRMLWRSDLGGHSHVFAYDMAGRLVARTGADPQTYTWLNTGKLAQVDGATAGNFSAYSYDAAGNKTGEVTLRDSITVQNASAGYDALGRMTAWNEYGPGVPVASTAYEYDLNGNVRRSLATYHALDQDGVASTVTSPQDFWYRYDSRGQVVQGKAALVGGVITGGIGYSYDAAGRRVTSTEYVQLSQKLWRHQPPWFGQVTWWDYQEDFGSGTWSWADYNYWGNRQEYYSYNADGTLASVQVIHDSVSGTGQPAATINAYGSGWQLKASFTYDAGARLTRQIDWLRNGWDAGHDRQIAYNAAGQIASETVANKQGVDTWTSYVTNDYGAGGSYALGAAVAVSTSEALNGVWQHSTTTANTHAWYDGAVLDHLSYNKAGVVSTTDYVLNGSGQLLSATISDSRPRTITYTNDMAGQIIRRDEADTNSSAGDPHEIWYRFDGRQLGMVGNNGTLETDYTRSIANRTQINGTGAFRFGGVGMAHQAEFGPNLQPITSYSQGGAGGSHIVRAGDSLSSIAAGLWGDAALWYKLAEANGLGGDTALAEGQVLLVPSGVLRSSHNASTFRPYDAADALGETSPVNPTPKARKNNKCGAFGAILLTVVAVAVTAIVAPWATGIAVNAGLGAVGGAIAGGAVAGVAASVASQGVGLATGIQDKFSWKGVALSALSGAVGGGLSHAKALAGGGFIGGFTRGAIGSAVSQGVGVVTGLQSKFDFAGVAAAGLGSGAAAGIGIATERWGSFGSSLAANTASGIANAAVRTLANGGSFGDNLIRALPDVIGSTVGNALAGAVARSSGVGGGKGGKAHAGMAAMEAGGPTTAPVAANEDAIVITGGANNPAMTDEEYDAGVAARNAEVDAREAQEDARLAAAATAGNQAPNDPLASLNLRYVTPLTIEQNHQTTRELVAHITSLRISDAKRDILLTAAYNRQADWDQRIAAATAAEAASIRAIFGNTSLLASGGSQNSWFSPAGNSQSPRLSSSSAPWGLSTSNGVVGSFILPALQHGLPTSSVGSNLWPYMQIGQTPFYGNQYVRTLQLAPIAEFAGRLSFGLGFALDINSYRQGQISGGKFALNTFMGVVGMRGGPWGAAAAAIYFGVDAFYEGGWSGLASDWQSFNARVEADRLRYNYGPRY